MTLLLHKFSNRITVSVLLISLAQFLVSCSKQNEEVPLDNADILKLTISVLGITEEGEVSLIAAKTSSGMKENVGLQSKVLAFEGFDAQVSVEPDIAETFKVSIGNGMNGGKGTELMAAAVANGVKYRLLLYEENGTFASSTLLTSGVVGEVDVVKGNSYNWYAISYHNTEDVPDVNPADPKLSLPGERDVLYASGSIAIPEVEGDVNVPLGIVFNHRLARVGIELNTMGMFADINTAALSVSGAAVKTATIDLKTGELTDLVDYTQAIDYSSFSDVEPPYRDRKVAYLYTADETPFNTLTVTLTNLVIELDDNNTNRSFQTLLGSNPSVFTFSNITPEHGKSYRALINMIESPLTLAGVRWARANLYYSGGHNPYRFHHTNQHTNARNTYFSFKGIVPSNFGVDGDPCSLVYPTGVWRQASEPNFRTLTGTLGFGGETATHGTIGGLGYFEYQAATGTAAPYPSNNLRFNMNGFGLSLGLVEGIIGINLGSTYGNQVHFWTSTHGLDLLGLAGVGAWYYNGQRTFGVNNINLSVSLLNITAIGIDVVESSFRNVRCVRND